MGSRYEFDSEGDYEPGSRGRVLRNLLGIRLVGDMQFAECQTLDAVQVWTIGNYDSHRHYLNLPVTNVARAD